MLKYTLGALIALVIFVATGFMILSRVTDGDANSGLAPGITFVAPADGPITPSVLEVEQDQIWEFALLNQRDTRLAFSVKGDGVEQLPELQRSGEAVGSPDLLPFIQFDAGPGEARAVLVRFREKGVFEAKLNIPGVFFPPEVITITVK